MLTAFHSEVIPFVSQYYRLQLSVAGVLHRSHFIDRNFRLQSQHPRGRFIPKPSRLTLHSVGRLSVHLRRVRQDLLQAGHDEAAHEVPLWRDYVSDVRHRLRHGDKSQTSYSKRAWLATGSSQLVTRCVSDDGVASLFCGFWLSIVASAGRLRGKCFFSPPEGSSSSPERASLCHFFGNGSR